MRLADRIAVEMTSRGVACVCWGDGVLVDACRDHVSLRNDHPINVMKAACDALERAPDRFQKFRMKGHDSRARARTVRAFKLIQ